MSSVRIKNGYEYHYSEGALPFPDRLNQPSRTILTGEGSILEEDWDALEGDEVPKFKRYFEETRFLFVIYQRRGLYLTENVHFWSMPNDDIEKFVHPVWQQTVKSIHKGQLETLPGTSFNQVCHVRPHAKTAAIHCRHHTMGHKLTNVSGLTKTTSGNKMGRLVGSKS